MANRIVVHQHGGPEVLQYEAYDVPAPGAGRSRWSATTAIGLNFIDVYLRTGLYPAPLPLTPGMEGAGVVEAVGAGVTDVQAGPARRLCRAPIGRLRRSPRHAGRRAGRRCPTRSRPRRRRR